MPEHEFCKYYKILTASLRNVKTCKPCINHGFGGICKGRISVKNKIVVHIINVG